MLSQARLAPKRSRLSLTLPAASATADFLSTVGNIVASATLHPSAVKITRPACGGPSTIRSLSPIALCAKKLLIPMSSIPSATEFGDAADRRAAVTTFDRNVVVTAGAGTGKTTLLIERLLHLLLRNPEPLKITEIVALTFTNKAADELKLRLRQRFHALLDVELDREPASELERRAKSEIAEMIALYHLSKDELESRVQDALRNLERSDLGTIHSFAANLLRLYPLEAGVDPQFHEDDGSAFERLFDEHWSLWLDHELSLGSAQADEWQQILRRCRLEQIKAMAKSIAAENVDLRHKVGNVTPIPSVLRGWL